MRTQKAPYVFLNLHQLQRGGVQDFKFPNGETASAVGGILNFKARTSWATEERMAVQTRGWSGSGDESVCGMRNGIDHAVGEKKIAS